jgi:hypothetical protein
LQLRLEPSDFHPYTLIWALQISELRVLSRLARSKRRDSERGSEAAAAWAPIDHLLAGTAQHRQHGKITDEL